MIAQETIDKIIERVGLVEVVGETVQLRRSGGNFSGLCPFHSEKSPSFHVRDDQGYFHCFGCGASGNVIQFVMQAKGLSFPEAVDELAARGGIQVQRSDQKQARGSGAETQALYRLNQIAADFYQRELSRAPKEVGQYLIERGLKPETIEAFQVGFAPQGWRVLGDFLKKQGAEKFLPSCGLVKRNPQGEWYDVFRGRIIFPIWQDNRRVVGFGGRLVPAFEKEAEKGALGPKYLNSPETKIYHKSKILFGLPQAIDAIRKSGLLYLVEGYMDVLGLWQAGVKNVVATCGTALTEEHVRRLSRLVKKMRIVFDGDQAGRTAAGKSLPVFMNSGIEVHALFIPDGEDPDTVALKHGQATEAYLQSLDRMSLLSCYVQYLSQTLAGSSVSELGAAGKGKVAQALCTQLAKVQNAVERSELLEEAARILKVNSSEIQHLAHSASAAPQIRTASPEPVEEPKEKETDQKIKQIKDLPRVDQELLRAVMARKDKLAQQVLKDPDVSMGIDRSSRSFIESLEMVLSDTGLSDEGKRESIKTVLTHFGPSWLALWKEAYKMQNDSEDVDFEAVFDECCRTIKKQKWQIIQRDIDRRVKSAPNDEAKGELLLEQMSIVRKIKSL